MPTNATGAGRPRGLARRVALLEAVLHLIGESGLEAVTHRRVAETAGLPLASTTYWFESKEHLLIAAFELAAQRDIARLRAYAAETLKAIDPLGSAIGAIVDPIGGMPQATRGSLLSSYTLLLEAARRPALRKAARRWSDAYLDVLAPMLELAGSEHSVADAELLLAAADGLLIDQLAVGTASDLRPRLRRLAKSLARPG